MSARRRVASWSASARRHARLRFDGRVTLAAVDPRDGSFAGVAQYAPGGDGTSDVTFAVADEWQRRGVGAMLALALLRRAIRRTAAGGSSRVPGARLPARPALAWCRDPMA